MSVIKAYCRGYDTKTGNPIMFFDVECPNKIPLTKSRIFYIFGICNTSFYQKCDTEYGLNEKGNLPNDGCGH